MILAGNEGDAVEREGNVSIVIPWAEVSRTTPTPHVLHLIGPQD